MLQSNRLDYRVQWLHVEMQPAGLLTENRTWKIQVYNFLSREHEQQSMDNFSMCAALN